MLFQVGDLKQVVVLAAAQQQDGLTAVLPIKRVLRPRLDALRIAHLGSASGPFHLRLPKRGCIASQQTNEKDKQESYTSSCGVPRKIRCHRTCSPTRRANCRNGPSSGARGNASKASITCQLA
jgi:hypothetical protein